MSASASEHELIQLIYRHLKQRGFHSAADELRRHSPQGEAKISASLLDIYKSWLNDSKKKRQPDSPKRSTSKVKGRTPAKVATQTVSNQTPADDDSNSEEVSQSLLPQVKTPKKKSSTISKQEAPATALTASPIVKPKKKKDKPVKQNDAQKKKPVPAKSKSAKNVTTVQISKKTQIKENLVSDGDHSDSDSSLDVEKWKKRVLQMTEDDIIKMDTINALDSNAPQPKKKRVRQSRAKAPEKSNTPVQPTNGTDEKNEKFEEKTVTATLEKISKPKKSSPKKTVSSSTRPSQEPNLNTAEDRPATSTASPLKQTPVKGKRKPVTPSKENTDETTSEPKKKKKKKEASEDNPTETSEDVTESHSKEEKTKKNEVTEQELCYESMEEKKKTKRPKGKSNETGEMMKQNKNGTADNKDLSELIVQVEKAAKKKREQADNVDNLEEVVEEVKVKKKKKKKKAGSEDHSGHNVEEERENLEQVPQSEAKQNAEQVAGEKKAKKKKRTDGEEMSEQKLEEETEQIFKSKKAKKKKKEKRNPEEENSALIIEEKGKKVEAEYNEDVSEQTVEENENIQRPESSDTEEKPDHQMEGKKKKKKDLSLKINSVDAEPLPQPSPETPGPPKRKKKKKIKLKSPEDLQFLSQTP